VNLLEVSDLKVVFDTRQGAVSAVSGLSFELQAGGTLGVVGESGSGKSQTVLAMLGLLPGYGRASGSVRFEGQELLGLPRAALNRIRGARIGLVFQDPMSSLNPYLKIGRQIGETLIRHRGMSRAESLRESVRLLDAVHLADARRRVFQYPHECSGGMRQRIAIAMALACRPQLLIADEPTTALDVTVQAQILRLLGELRREFGLAVLLISHDLDVVAQLAERTLVLYAGRLMEQGDTAALLANPTHPYTQALLRCRPRLQVGAQTLAAIPGMPPDPLRLPFGCAFQPRCGYARPPCDTEQPEPVPRGGVLRACHAEISTVQSG
jgi:oligopeptide transport system ATP-binding protein